MKPSLNVHSTFVLMSRSTIVEYTPHVLELHRAEATICLKVRGACSSSPVE